MVRVLSGRLAFVAVALFGLLAVAAPASAQTGMLKGKVLDGKGQPVEGAKVVISMTQGMNRKYEVKTNKKGEFVQIGIQPGMYLVSAEKEGVGVDGEETKIGIGENPEMKLTLAAKAAAGPSKEDLALEKAFQDGVAATRANNFPEAVAKFQEALKMRPDCFDCYYNMGIAHAQAKELDKAEAAFKEAIKLKADHPAAYGALANLYNAQKRFDEAVAMTNQAAKLGGAGAGGASADAAFNQGVILWNAGKYEEARQQFEQAVKLKPDFAEAQYQLGMAYLNLGKLAEAKAPMELYLKLAPNGPNAAMAKQILSSLPK
jgi:Flp pilus assembly protein TadD